MIKRFIHFSLIISLLFLATLYSPVCAGVHVSYDARIIEYFAGEVTRNITIVNNSSFPEKINLSIGHFINIDTGNEYVSTHSARDCIYLPTNNVVIAPYTRQNVYLHIVPPYMNKDEFYASLIIRTTQDQYMYPVFIRLHPQAAENSPFVFSDLTVKDNSLFSFKILNSGSYHRRCLVEVIVKTDKEKYVLFSKKIMLLSEEIMKCGFHIEHKDNPVITILCDKKVSVSLFRLY